MPTLVERIIELLTSERGRDVHRVVMLLLLAFVAWRVVVVERDLAAHLGYHKGYESTESAAPKSGRSFDSILDAPQLGGEVRAAPRR